MITVSKATSIDYYTSAAGVAAGMESYYTDAVTDGEPPGVWLGAGAQSLGLVGEVDAVDMHVLFSRFVHPHTGTQFGSAPAQRRSRSDRVAAAVARQPDPSPERVGQIERSVTDRSTVIGWDLTFAAPKSVTIIHTAAMRAQIAASRSGDLDQAAWFGWIREQIEQSVAEANVAGLAEAERLATARTGGGAGGAMRWVPVAGLVVASFPQTTNRSIEPHLHQHNVVLNRAMCTDGKVRALDGRDLIAARFGFSAVAARTLTEALGARLGLGFRPHADGAGWEVDLVSAEVIDFFSHRAVQTTKAMEPLVAAEVERWGRDLTNRELAMIHRAAQRGSRAAKTHDGETIEEMHSRWAAELVATTGRSLNGVARALSAKVRAVVVGSSSTASWSPTQVVAEAVAATAQRAATWGRADLLWQLHVTLPPMGIEPSRVASLLNELADQGLSSAEVVQVTGLRASTGFVAPSTVRYAAASTLVAEEALRTAAVVRGRLSVPRADAAAWVERWTPTLGVDQRAAVEGIASSDAALTVLEGPAGTGKSYTVGALAGAWQDLTGGRVFGLAVSQIATGVLVDDGVGLSRNIAAWLTTQQRLAEHGVESVGPEGSDRVWALGPADVVLVDEASMVATADLIAIRAHVDAAGARLVLTGDPHQLTAVEAGGVMGLFEGHAETYTLTDVRRFTHLWERSASLALRDGDLDALVEYDRHGRLVGYSTDHEAVDAAASACVADRVDGRTTVVVAATNAVAAAISGRVRDRLVQLGIVGSGPAALLGRDGNAASVGDVVMCRRNDHTIGVTNRAQYQVADVVPDGDGWVLTVHRLTEDGPAGQPIALPASYTGVDVQLAYASTVHAAQGLTVDNAHLVAGAGMNPATVYVGMTRGSHRNTVHVGLNVETSDRVTSTVHGVTVELSGTTRTPTALSALSAVIDSEIRSDESQAALVAAERDTRTATSASTLTAQIEFETRRACRDRLERHLDGLVSRGVLDPETRGRLAADQATEHLSRLLRASEQVHLDPAQVLADAVAGRGLIDADSPAQVLSHRITTAHKNLSDLDHITDTIPADISPQAVAALSELADKIKARAMTLGEQTAQDPPGWAINALGPVPAEPGPDRADWLHRAGVIATHREAVGDTSPDRPLSAMPGLSNLTRRATFATAFQAAGGIDTGLREAAMSDGRLLTRITAWRREQQWEPPYVDTQLRDHETLLEKARHSAAICQAKADTTAHGERARLLAEADTHRRTQDTEMETVAALTRAAETRSQWVAQTATTRLNHDRAVAEAQRRGLDLTTPPPDTTTGPAWDQDRAAVLAEDKDRTITDRDLRAEDEDLLEDAQQVPGVVFTIGGIAARPLERVSIEALKVTTAVAIARLADHHNQDLVHIEDGTTAFEAGRRRREAADLRIGPVRDAMNEVSVDG